MDNKNTLITKKEAIFYFKKYLDIENSKEYDKEENYLLEEIGDGNINYVYRLKFLKDKEKSIIFKFAHKNLRVTPRPLDQNRIKIEAHYLKLAYDFQENKKVPKIFEFNENRKFIVMEDIGIFKNLRYELMERKIHKNLSKNVMEFLISMAINTNDILINPKKKKLLVKEFINPDMCEISENIVFREPYDDFKGENIFLEEERDFVSNELYNDKELRVKILQLREKFKNDTSFLIHGDLHSGSIFAYEDKIKIIDSEFAFFGPIEYDIGNYLAHLIIDYFYHIFIGNEKAKENNFLKYILGEISFFVDNIFKRLLEEFLINLKKTQEKFFYTEEYLKEYIENIRKYSFKYAATEIIRRVVGSSKVREIDEIIKTNNIVLIKSFNERLILLSKRLILENLSSLEFLKELEREIKC